MGIFAVERIRGRGAWWDEGRTVLHLGDRLITPEGEHPITKPFSSRHIYQRLERQEGPCGVKPLTVEEAAVIVSIANRFRWEVPASGTLLQGWVVLAPICGALRWRPHLWLTAGAGSGKSQILDRFVVPLLGDLRLSVSGATTEAGLRQTICSDAVPVVFDEAESNEKGDQQRMQAILSLARVASSESSAEMLKGSPSGDVSRYRVRSMFLMSSIATALKQGADKSRFAQLTLRSPTEMGQEEREAHWQSLDRDLERYITPQLARRLIARTVSLIPVIRQSVVVFSAAAARHFDSQRLGDQYGTLMAGAWSLLSDAVPSQKEAEECIDGPQLGQLQPEHRSSRRGPLHPDDPAAAGAGGDRRQARHPHHRRTGGAGRLPQQLHRREPGPGGPDPGPPWPAGGSGAPAGEQHRQGDRAVPRRYRLAEQLAGGAAAPGRCATGRTGALLWRRHGQPCGRHSPERAVTSSRHKTARHNSSGNAQIACPASDLGLRNDVTLQGAHRAPYEFKDECTPCSTRHCCLLMPLYLKKGYIVTGTARSHCRQAISAVTPIVTPRHN